MKHLVETSDIEIVRRGELPDTVAEQARRKVTALVERLGDPVAHVRIRLTHRPDPSVARPVRAQANLHVDGQSVCVQVAGTTGEEAVDLMVDRLRRRLVRLKRHWEARRGGVPLADPHEWRHGRGKAHHPPYYPRAVEERQIIRHRSFSPARLTSDEAAWEMYRMDYAFFLFTEAGTDGDAVLYRGGPTGFRLARLESGPRWLGFSNVPITLSPHPAPRLTVAQARRRLESTGLPFVFFADPASGRAKVLYHRYDGHYGLITPAG